METSLHEDLLAAIRQVQDFLCQHRESANAGLRGPALIIVTGLTGHGKTTAIHAVLADSRCPPGIIFVGDIRGEVNDALSAIELAQANIVVAVLRISCAAAAFGRLRDMGVPAQALLAALHSVFTTRLLRPTDLPPLLVHEQLVVTDPIRDLVRAGEDNASAIHRRAVADGMRSVRQRALAYLASGRIDTASVDCTPADG